MVYDYQMAGNILLWLAGLNIVWDWHSCKGLWACVTCGDFHHFSEANDCPLHSPEGRQMPAVRAVQGDCERVYIRLFTFYQQVLNILGKKFGCSKNKKGFNVLPPYLRVIQGDGISLETLEAILSVVRKNEWSSENLVFGSGGALLQKMNRDTQKCAFKCSYALIAGKEVRVSILTHWGWVIHIYVSKLSHHWFR